MLRKFGIAAVLTLALIAPQAHAAKGSMTIGANGGMLVPSGDFGDGFKSGWCAGIFGDYGINDQFAVGIDIGTSGSKHNDDGTDAALTYPLLTGTIKDNATIMPFLVHGKYMFPMGEQKLHPYVTAGMGMYSFKEKFETTGFSEEASDSKFGGRGGAGFTYMLTPKFGIDVEGNYHLISTDVKSTTFMTFTAGLSMPLGGK